MKLLTFTSLYPNAAQPTHGVFVENRLRRLVAAGTIESRVVAPVPWFPSGLSAFGRYGAFARVPRREERHGLALYHPRFAAIPMVGMALSPDLMARGARRSVMHLIESGYDFDIIDAHYFYPDGVAAALLAESLRKPLVITARGSDINLFPHYGAARRRILWAAGRAAHIITVSAALQVRLIELGVPEEKITVIRNGVDLEVFAPQDRAVCRRALGLQGPSLLMVGSLVALKGHRLVIEALARLPDWSLMIAGEGPERGALERQAERLGLGQRVRFLGTLAHEALPKLYSAADLLVLASSREGIANVLLESMACGTPVVTTAVGGCAEVVTSSDAGAVLPECSPQALREAIESLWAKRPDRGRTRRHAARFDWAETTREQAALLHKLCAQHTSLSFNLYAKSSSPRAPGPVAGPVPLEKTAD